MKLSVLGNFYFGKLSITNLNCRDCYKQCMKMSKLLYAEGIYHDHIFFFILIVL